MPDTKKRRKRKPLHPDEVANHAMKNCVQYARAQRGNMDAIVKRYAELTGEPVARQTVARWLHEDEDKRTQPLLGNALVLMLAVLTLADEEDTQAIPTVLPVAVAATR